MFSKCLSDEPLEAVKQIIVQTALITACRARVSIRPMSFIKEVTNFPNFCILYILE